MNNEIILIIKKIDEYNNEQEYLVKKINYVLGIKKNYFLKKFYDVDYKILLPDYYYQFFENQDGYKIYIQFLDRIFPVKDITFIFFQNSSKIKNIEIMI